MEHGVLRGECLSKGGSTYRMVECYAYMLTVESFFTLFKEMGLTG